MASGVGYIAPDEFLDPFDFLLLVTVPMLFKFPPRHPFNQISLQSSRVGVEPAKVDLPDFLHGVTQESPIVGYDDKRDFQLLQILLQPHGRFDIQVVGRFVQEEQIASSGQKASQSGAVLFAAGKSAKRVMKAVGVEAETAQNQRYFVLKGRASGRLEDMLKLTESFETGAVMRVLSKALLK